MATVAESLGWINIQHPLASDSILLAGWECQKFSGYPRFFDKPLLSQERLKNHQLERLFSGSFSRFASYLDAHDRVLVLYTKTFVLPPAFAIALELLALLRTTALMWRWSLDTPSPLEQLLRSRNCPSGCVFSQVKSFSMGYDLFFHRSITILTIPVTGCA